MAPADERPRHRLIVDSLYRGLYRVVATVARGVFLVVRPHLQGVAVVVWCEGRMLLVRNSYRADLGLPGGLLRRGETRAEAAARELHEETGIVVEPAALRDAGLVEAFHANVNDHVQFFEIELDEEPALVVDHREVVWAGFEPLEAVRGQRQLWVPLRLWLAPREDGE